MRKPIDEPKPSSETRKRREVIQRLKSKSEEINNSAQRVHANFLITDLDLALILAGTALDAPPGSDKRLRNIPRVHEAYDTVLRLRKRVRFTPLEAGELKAKLSQVKSALEKLVGSRSPKIA